MQIDHLNKETTDGTVRNLDALYQLFPSCFTEAKDAVTGKMRRVVDWGKLRELLGEYVESDEPEKYDFTWVGKRAAQRETSALVKASGALSCDHLTLIAFSQTRDVKIDGKTIHIISALEWLLK